MILFTNAPISTPSDDDAAAKPWKWPTFWGLFHSLLFLKISSSSCGILAHFDDEIKRKRNNGPIKCVSEKLRVSKAEERIGNSRNLPVFCWFYYPLMMTTTLDSDLFTKPIILIWSIFSHAIFSQLFLQNQLPNLPFIFVILQLIQHKTCISFRLKKII